MNAAAPSPSQSGKPHWRLAVSVLIIAAIALLAWKLWPKPAPHRKAPAIPVAAGHAVTVDIPIWVTAVGTVRALNAVDVKVRVDGQLQKVMFKEGQDVRAGQVLAQLDQGPLTAQLHQAEAAQRKDQASLDNAKLDVDRYTKLAAIGATTSQTLDTAKALVQSQTAAVAADAALVETERLQLSFTTLYAPFTGRVGMREADIGAIVHPGDATGVVTVTQMEPISVLFSVQQDFLPGVLANQGQAPQEVTVTARTDPTPLAKGTLVFVDSQVDPTTGQIRLKASFDNEKRTLWPGQLVNAQLLLRTDRQRMAVPNRAIVNTQTGAQLYVVTADNGVQLRNVQTGANVGSLTEIKSGISTDDLVIFDGQSRVSATSKVKTTIIPALPPAAGAAPGKAGSPS